VFAAGDWDGLAKRLDHWLTNVNRLRELRSAARNLAESLSWGRFRSRLREACASDPNTARLS
jgi:glycosyltransferase involved in cell wall biosynthesis